MSQYQYVWESLLTRKLGFNLKLEHIARIFFTHIDRDALVMAARFGGKLADQLRRSVRNWVDIAVLSEWCTLEKTRLGQQFDFLTKGLQAATKQTFAKKKKHQQDSIASASCAATDLPLEATSPD